jgi:tetratricopeptide (TPR) repeat protein
LAKADPTNVGWQQNLSASHFNIGDVLRAQGDLPAALESFRASLTITERLAKADPGNARWQSDLSQSLNKNAGVQIAAGKREEGLANYSKSLAILEKLAAVIEAAETESGGKTGSATVGALGNVSWQAVLARDYAKALSAADRALSIMPNALWIELNRAHALMFLGRTGEARRLYLAHSKEKIAEVNKPWKQAVAEDFAELRNAGVTDPLMPKIEMALQ